MKNSAIIIFVGMLCLMSVNLRAQLNISGMPPEADEAGFLTAYRNYRTNIPTVFYKDSLYLPLIQTLSFLKIYFIADNNLELISGYVARRDSSFEIDFSANQAKFNRRNISFSESDYLKTELDIFVLPSFLTKVFDFSFRIRQSDLMVYIESKEDLPLVAADKRKNKHSYLDPTNSYNEDYPLMFDRKWSILDGGVLNYSLGASHSNLNRYYRYLADAGLMLFGGDLRVNARGAYSDLNQDFSAEYRGYWRLSFADNNWISNITAGSIYPLRYRAGDYNSINLPFEQITGFQISNETHHLEHNFSTFVIDDKIDPNWQVELYVNGQLFDHQTTDALGYFRFELPVRYGNTNVELKYYGPNGEFVDKSRAITVPSDFLSPGKVKYTILGGQNEQTSQYLSQGSLSMGLTDWLTTTVSGQIEEQSLAYDFLVRSVVRLTGNLMMSIDYSPEKALGGGLNFWSSDYGTYRLSFNNFKGMSVFNTRGAKNSINLDASLPRLGNLPLNIIIRSSAIETDRSVYGNLSSELRYFFHPFDIGVRYMSYYSNFGSQAGDMRQEISPRLTWSWFNKPNFLSFLNNTRLTASFSYNRDLNRITRSDVYLDQVIMKNVRFGVNFNKDFQSGLSSINCGIQMDLQPVRSVSSANYQIGQSGVYSQDISGIIGFDSKNVALRFNGMQSYASLGTGAATFRFFLDENNNEKFDIGEYEIPDVRVRVSMGMSPVKSHGYTIIYNLPLGCRINANVDENSFKNPLWVPKFTEFSFITDPNTFKTIDVPCYVAGIIEGRVQKGDISKSGQSGVKLQFINQKTREEFDVPVFSDGSFYKMGVPPGKYTAQVDSMQLAILKCKSVPEFIEFEVKPSEFGDFISNLNFVLFDADSMDVWQKGRKHMIAMQLNKLKEHDNSGGGLAMSGALASNDNEQTTLAHSSEIIETADYDDFLKGFNDDAPENAGMIEGKILFDDEILKGDISDFHVYIEGIDNKYITKSGVFGDGSYFGNGLAPGKYRVYPAKYSLDRLECKAEPMYREIEIKNNPIGDAVFNVSFKLVK